MHPIGRLGITFFGGVALLGLIGRLLPKGPEPKELNCQNGALCKDPIDPTKTEVEYEPIKVPDEPKLAEAIHCLNKPILKQKNQSGFEEYLAYKEAYNLFCVNPQTGKEKGEVYKQDLREYFLSKYRHHITTKLNRSGLDRISTEMRNRALAQIGPISISSLKNYKANEGLDFFFENSCQKVWYSINPCCPEPTEAQKGDASAKANYDKCRDYVPKKILFDTASTIKNQIFSELVKKQEKYDPKPTIKNRTTSIFTKTKDLTFRTTYTGRQAPIGTVLLIKDLDRPPAWDQKVRYTLASKMRVIEIAIPRTGDGRNILPERLDKIIIERLFKSKQLNNDPIYTGPKVSASIKYLNSPINELFGIVVKGDYKIENAGRKLDGYGRILTLKIAITLKDRNFVGLFFHEQTRPGMKEYLERIGKIEIETPGWVKYFNNTIGWYLGVGYEPSFAQIGYQSHMTRSFITPLAKAMWTGRGYPGIKRLCEFKVDTGKPDELAAKLIEKFK